jgi:hypothetical protein
MTKASMQHAQHTNLPTPSPPALLLLAPPLLLPLPNCQ